MDDRTLIALKQSIEKWEKRAAGEHGGRLGTANCPLCKLFFPFCLSCPVGQSTKQFSCQGTPYHKYVSDRTDRNAKAELDFLRSFLPEEQKEKQTFKWADLDYLG